MTRFNNRLQRLEEAVAPRQPSWMDRYYAFRAYTRLQFEILAGQLIQLDHASFATLMEIVLGYPPDDSSTDSHLDSFKRELEAYTPQQRAQDEAVVSGWLKTYGKLPENPSTPLTKDLQGEETDWAQRAAQFLAEHAAGSSNEADSNGVINT
jgi:hypothetical protein